MAKESFPSARGYLEKVELVFYSDKVELTIVQTTNFIKSNILIDAKGVSVSQS